MPAATRPNHGFTLVELLLVTVMLGILAAMVLPSASSSGVTALDGTAQIIASDLAYIRQLALTNATTYRVTFDLVKNEYYVEHTGSNPVWDNLEVPPYGSPASITQRYVVELNLLPTLGTSAVVLDAVGHQAGTFTPTTQLEFNSLGATTASDDTSIWLSVEGGSVDRFVEVRVDAVSGLAWVQPITTSGSPGSAPSS